MISSFCIDPTRIVGIILATSFFELHFDLTRIPFKARYDMFNIRQTHSLKIIFNIFVYINRFHLRMNWVINQAIQFNINHLMFMAIITILFFFLCFNYIVYFLFNDFLELFAAETSLCSYVIKEIFRILNIIILDLYIW